MIRLPRGRSRGRYAVAVSYPIVIIEKYGFPDNLGDIEIGAGASGEEIAVDFVEGNPIGDELTVELETVALPDDARDELPEEFSENPETLLAASHIAVGMPHREEYCMHALFVRSIGEFDISFGRIGSADERRINCKRFEGILEGIEARDGGETETEFSGEFRPFGAIAEKIDRIKHKIQEKQDRN